MIRFSRIAVLAALAAVIALVLAACGDGDDSAADTSGPAGQDLPSTSVPVVAGPSHAPPAATEPPAPPPGDDVCGRTTGADIPLEVKVLDGDVNCADAMELARQYSPLIATGEEQSVGGWDCGPTAESGVIAACQSGDQRVGFVIY